MTSTPVVITETDALNGLRSAVSARGASYIYQGPYNDGQTQHCVYAWRAHTNGAYEPMCIVGHALSTLGVPLRLMVHCANDETIAGLALQLLKHGYFITPDAVSVFAAAQHVQDHATVGPVFIDPFTDALSQPLPTCGAHGCPGTVSDATWGAALKAATDQARANADARRHHAETVETLRQQAAAADAELAAARELVREVEWLLISSAETVLALTAV
jgi:hypothetical protein